MARDRQAEYARRDARAKDLGFRSYADQRARRVEAIEAGVPSGNTKGAIAQRDAYGFASTMAPGVDRIKKIADHLLKAGLSPRKLMPSILAAIPY